MEASSSSGVPLSPTPPTSSTDPGPGGDGESSSYAIIRSVSVESGQQEVGPSDPQPPGSDDKKSSSMPSSEASASSTTSQVYIIIGLRILGCQLLGFFIG